MTKALLTTCGLILLQAAISGCASKRALQYDYDAYPEAYAYSANRQLLLNLARESHQDPVYFLQLGQISSQYQFTTSAGFMPSASRVDPESIMGVAGGLVQHTLTLGGNFTAGATQTPQFQFFPLNGSSYFEALTSQIPENMLWTFYNLGWPANWVLRTMVSSITIKKNYVSADFLKNHPDFPANRMDTVLLNDPIDPSYPGFLRFCDNVRKAQLFQMLVVDSATNSVGRAIFSGPANGTQLNQIMSAIEAGFPVKCGTNGIVTVEDRPKVSIGLVVNRNWGEPLYKNFMANSITYSNVEKFVKPFPNFEIRYKMRTFESTLNAVANEQAAFEFCRTNCQYPGDFPTNYITFTNDPYGPIATNYIPGSDAFAVRPILTLNYSPMQRQRLSTLVELEYGKKMYSVGYFGPGEDVFSIDTAQNRAVFTMLSYLFSQVAIETTNLPVQQLIQLQ